MNHKNLCLPFKLRRGTHQNAILLTVLRLSAAEQYRLNIYCRTMKRLVLPIESCLPCMLEQNCTTIHTCNWTFPNVAKCNEHFWTLLIFLTLQNITKHLWTFLNISEHFWTLLNITEHYWRLLNVTKRIINKIEQMWKSEWVSEWVSELMKTTGRKKRDAVLALKNCRKSAYFLSASIFCMQLPSLNIISILKPIFTFAWPHY